MPWSTDDVDGFKKGLDDDEKAKWVAIANAVLADCLEKGGERSECEKQAIMTANART